MFLFSFFILTSFLLTTSFSSSAADAALFSLTLFFSPKNDSVSFISRRKQGRYQPTGGVARFNRHQTWTLSSKVMRRCRRHPCILPHPSLPRSTIVDKMDDYICCNGAPYECQLAFNVELPLALSAFLSWVAWLNDAGRMITFVAIEHHMSANLLLTLSSPLHSRLSSLGLLGLMMLTENKSFFITTRVSLDKDSTENEGSDGEMRHLISTSYATSIFNSLCLIFKVVIRTRDDRSGTFSCRIKLFLV